MPPILHLSLPVTDLEDARRFYEEVLDCRVGRVRDRWLDVWFFGMQLTLQEHPEQVLPAHEQGVRHFGVALDRGEFEEMVARLRDRGVTSLGEESSRKAEVLSGKTAVKVTDPTGNVVEFKYYEDATEYLG